MGGHFEVTRVNSLKVLRCAATLVAAQRNSHGLPKDLSRAKFWYKSASINKITSTGMKQAREHLIERLNILLDHGSVDDYLG